jgi:hypothetical protein
VSFFDIISFFAIAALFAWLGYAPLQGQAVRESNWDIEDRNKAEDSLGAITDYFMLSFCFFSVSALSDYVLRFLLSDAVRYASLIASGMTFILLLTVGTMFVIGLVCLIVPMAYVRTVGRKGRGFSDLSPPPFRLTFLILYLSSVNAFIIVAEFFSNLFAFTKLIGLVADWIVSITFSVVALKNWDSWDQILHFSKKGVRVTLYFILALSPILMLFIFVFIPPLVDFLVRLLS